jgi:hypothetical protein
MTRMLRRHVMAALAPVLFVPGCLSDPTAPTTDDPAFVQLLYGSWSWISAEGGIAGQTVTPETEGYAQTFVLTSPDRVELLRDGVTVAVTTFEFVPARDSGGQTESAMLRYASPIFGWDEQAVALDPVGNLVLTDPCCDGFVYLFGPS